MELPFFCLSSTCSLAVVNQVRRMTSRRLRWKRRVVFTARKMSEDGGFSVGAMVAVQSTR